MKRKGTRPAILLLPVTGFAIWGGAFVLLYGAQGAGCRLGWGEIAIGSGISLHHAILVSLFGGFLAGLSMLAIWLVRRKMQHGRHSGTTAFINRTSRDLAIAALASALFCFIWVFWLSAC